MYTHIHIHAHAENLTSPARTGTHMQTQKQTHTHTYTWKLVLIIIPSASGMSAMSSSSAGQASNCSSNPASLNLGSILSVSHWPYKPVNITKSITESVLLLPALLSQSTTLLRVDGIHGYILSLTDFSSYFHFLCAISVYLSSLIKNHRTKQCVFSSSLGITNSSKKRLTPSSDPCLVAATDQPFIWKRNKVPNIILHAYVNILQSFLKGKNIINTNSVHNHTGNCWQEINNTQIQKRPMTAL